MFIKATKASQKLKLLLQGASGSGKTYSALILATEIIKKFGGRIAFIDSENGSASLYSDKFDFDVMELKDYSVSSYIKEMEEAMNSKEHTICIIDSITQEWEWILDQVTAITQASSSKNSYNSWAIPSEYHNKFLKTILKFNKHLICTVRAKQDYDQKNENGKKSIVKLGLAPIQREGIEYEFTTAFMINHDNKAEATKDRTDIFKSKGLFKISPNEANELLDWLDNAPAQKEQELLQQAKEHINTIQPELYIEYINKGDLPRKISNTEIVLELKKYAFDKAMEQGYKISIDKTKFENIEPNLDKKIDENLADFMPFSKLEIGDIA